MKTIQKQLFQAQQNMSFADKQALSASGNLLTNYLREETLTIGYTNTKATNNALYIPEQQKISNLGTVTTKFYNSLQILHAKTKEINDDLPFKKHDSATSSNLDATFDNDILIRGLTRDKIMSRTLVATVQNEISNISVASTMTPNYMNNLNQGTTKTSNFLISIDNQLIGNQSARTSINDLYSNQFITSINDLNFNSYDTHKVVYDMNASSSQLTFKNHGMSESITIRDTFSPKSIKNDITSLESTIISGSAHENELLTLLLAKNVNQVERNNKFTASISTYKSTSLFAETPPTVINVAFDVDDNNNINEIHSNSNVTIFLSWTTELKKSLKTDFPLVKKIMILYLKSAQRNLLGVSKHTKIGEKREKNNKSRSKINLSNDTVNFYSPYKKNENFDNVNSDNDKQMFKKPFLLIIVASKPGNFKQRKVIRDTWAKVSNEVSTCFFIGTFGLNNNLLELINREKKIYDDVMTAPFVDSYANLTLKSIAMLLEVSKAFTEASFYINNIEVRSSSSDRKYHSSKKNNVTNYNDIYNTNKNINNERSINIRTGMDSLGNHKVKSEVIKVRDMSNARSKVWKHFGISPSNNDQMNGMDVTEVPEFDALRKLFLMKIDDDTFVNVEALLDLLRGLPLNEHIRTNNELYSIGYLHKKSRPIRSGNSEKDEHEPINESNGNKWVVPYELYPHEFYPNYLSGSGYVLSGKAVKRLAEVAYTVPAFFIEDVHVTGMLGDIVGLQRNHNPKFMVNDIKHFNSCSSPITSHYVKIPKMLELWKTVKLKILSC